MPPEVDIWHKAANQTVVREASVENVIRFRMVWRLAWAQYHLVPPPPDGWFGEAVTRKLEIPCLNPGQTIPVYIYITPLCSKQCSLHCCLYIYMALCIVKKTIKKVMRKEYGNNPNSGLSYVAIFPQYKIQEVI